MGSKLYVGGLPYATTELQLNDLFGSHGTVESTRVITDKFTDQSLCCGRNSGQGPVRKTSVSRTVRTAV